MCVSRSGELFVADPCFREPAGVFRKVCVLRASDGTYLRSFEWPAAADRNRSSPSFICLSPDEECLIVAEMDPGRHIRILRASDGALVRTLILDQGMNTPIIPAGICVSPDGELLYVSDDVGHNRVFLIRLADGSLVRTLGSRGHDAGQFDSPAGMSLSPSGELYVADRKKHRVQVFRTSDGAYVQMFGGDDTFDGNDTDRGRRSYPVDVVCSGEWLLVADEDHVHVRRASDGEHVKSIALPLPKSPNGFTHSHRACLSPIDHDRQLLVSDSTRGCIFVFTA
jgi:hypothetical protein